jgi:hypothetical protein
VLIGLRLLQELAPDIIQMLRGQKEELSASEVKAKLEKCFDRKAQADKRLVDALEKIESDREDG